jgi:hypothetical protein
MTPWDLEAHFTFEVFISMMYNDINTLDPSWEDSPSYIEIW